jgi:hypothetical protein
LLFWSVDQTTIASLHHAGIIFETSLLVFHAETTVITQAFLASVIALQTSEVLGSQAHQKLIFITFMLLFIV